MKAFNKNIASKKIKLKQNKNAYVKRLSISLSCMFLLVIVMLFTFAKFESNSPEYVLINGRVDSATSDFNVVSYIYDGETNSQPPSKNDGYILTDLTCTNATGEWDDVNWKLTVSGLSNKVKCTLTFDNQSNYKIIEYNPNGGYLAEQYIKGTIGEQIGNLPTPIKTGYTFAGWYKEASLTTQVQSTTVVDSSFTNLYAKYTENTTTINTLGESNVENYVKANFTLPNGYVATSSITSVTPSASGTQFSAGYTNMTTAGYAYSSRPSGTMQPLTGVTTLVDSTAATSAKTISWTCDQKKLYLVLQLYVSDGNGGYTSYGDNTFTNLAWTRRISKNQTTNNAAYHAHRIILCQPASDGTCSVRFTGSTTYGRFFYSVYEFTPDEF